MNPTSLARHDASAMIDGSYAWTRLAVSVLLATIGGVGLWSVVVVLPAVQAEFEVSRADASLPFTVTMLGFAAGNVLIGRAIDRWGYWRPALAASLTLAAGFGLAAVTTSIIQFALVQGLLIGVGSSAIFGPLIADISHWFQRRRGVAVAIAATGNYIAGAIWPLVMPYLMDTSGWRFTYAVIGVVCLVAMLPLVLMLRRPAPLHQAASSGGARTVQPISLSPTALQALLVIAGLSCCAAMSMPQVHLVAYCLDLGYGVARGAEMLSIMLAAGVVSRLASGFLADHIGGVKTVLIGSGLQCLALLFYLPFDGLAALYIVSAIFGLSQGCDRRARIHAARRGRPARRHRHDVDDARHGAGWLDVGLDLRSDRLLCGGLHERHRLESAQHLRDDADPVAIVEAIGRPAGVTEFTR
jgi:predicted MFS family arabinose efflux permease